MFETQGIEAREPPILPETIEIVRWRPTAMPESTAS